MKNLSLTRRPAEKLRPAELDEADESALAAAARSDPAAFGELYRRYVARVYRYLFSRLGNKADAEDLTAQVFTAAWESIARYREQGSFAAWIFQIARHKAGDFYRRERKHMTLEDADPYLPGEPDPLHQVVQGETLKRLSALVSRLEAEQQELLRLRFSADLSYAEMAGLLGRSEAAVKMATLRLVRQLQAGVSGDVEATQ